MASKEIEIKWIYSAIGRSKDQHDTIRGLGLRKLNQVRKVPDTPEIRGMIFKVKHLLKVLGE